MPKIDTFKTSSEIEQILKNNKINLSDIKKVRQFQKNEILIIYKNKERQILKI
jgi:hypothetical protein